MEPVSGSLIATSVNATLPATMRVAMSLNTTASSPSSPRLRLYQPWVVVLPLTVIAVLSGGRRAHLIRDS